MGVDKALSATRPAPAAKRGKSPRPSVSRVLRRKLPARLKVSYTDGRWTHDLWGKAFALEIEGANIVLKVDLQRYTPAAKGVDSPCAMCVLQETYDLIDTIQVAKSGVRKLIEAALLEIENPQFGVILTQGETTFSFPASVVVDPDAVTMSIG